MASQRVADIAPSSVSIIVPTFNEADNVARLSRAALESSAEWIIVDGGSSDGTARLLTEAGVNVLASAKGRGVQMNAGAARASRPWLIFLHADTILPPASLRYFEALVDNQPHLAGGAFAFKMDQAKLRYRYLEWYVHWRCRLLKMPFGDQAIFVRRSLFKEMGGFRADIPIMEDLEFIQRLKKRGRLAILPVPVVTSARRYEREGFFKRAGKNLAMQMLYKLGFPASKLSKLYE